MFKFDRDALYIDWLELAGILLLPVSPSNGFPPLSAPVTTQDNNSAPFAHKFAAQFVDFRITPYNSPNPPDCDSIMNWGFKSAEL
jgi:hypothetical protein